MGQEGNQLSRIELGALDNHDRDFHLVFAFLGGHGARPALGDCGVLVHECFDFET